MKYYEENRMNNRYFPENKNKNKNFIRLPLKCIEIKKIIIIISSTETKNFLKVYSPNRHVAAIFRLSVFGNGFPEHLKTSLSSKKFDNSIQEVCQMDLVHKIILIDMVNSQYSDISREKTPSYWHLYPFLQSSEFCRLHSPPIMPLQFRQ